MDKNKEVIKKLKYIYIDTKYDEKYVSYPSIDELTNKINEIIEYINKEDK